MTSLISSDDHATLWALMALGTALAIWLEQRYRWAGRLSGPVIALLIAMFLSNTRIVPTEAPAYDFVGAWLVPLAIPLLLFRADLREIMRTGGRVFLLFHLSALGTAIGTIVAYASLRSHLGSPTAEHASGMMAASFTGGGVNFMAVKTSYQVDENMAANLIVADNFVMAALFIGLLALGGSRWMLARYTSHAEDEVTVSAGNLAAEHWKRKDIGLLDVARSLGFAFAAMALAQGIGRLLNLAFGQVTEPSLPIEMLHVLSTNRFVLITLVTLVLATIFTKTLKRINGPEEIGTYLLFLFLFTLGLPTDLVSVLEQAPILFLFCAIIALVNLSLTLGIGKLLRANLRELLVAINANLGGPPTAAAMAISSGWPRLVLPGVLAGIWGYVIGTPIGVLFVEMLSR